MLRAGINYKFGGYGKYPVVAKYERLPPEFKCERASPEGPALFIFGWPCAGAEIGMGSTSPGMTAPYSERAGRPLMRGGLWTASNPEWVLLARNCRNF